MGAVTKAGSTNLNGVYRYAEQARGPGLVFMDTPGYDVVSITGMIAGCANLVCFTLVSFYTKRFQFFCFQDPLTFPPITARPI